MPSLVLTFLFALLLVACSNTGGQNTAKAVHSLQKASGEGSAEAQLALGYLYVKGHGIPKDIARGLELFKKAARQGNKDAQYNTGLAYVRGEIIQQDYEEALKWFEMAAEQDDAGAQYNLGVMSMNGEGTVRDPLFAYIWFKLASEKAYEGASEGMELAKSMLKSDQIERLDSEMVKVRERIDRTKPRSASVDLGNMPL